MAVLTYTHHWLRGISKIKKNIFFRDTLVHSVFSKAYFNSIFRSVFMNVGIQMCIYKYFAFSGPHLSCINCKAQLFRVAAELGIFLSRLFQLFNIILNQVQFILQAMCCTQLQKVLLPLGTDFLRRNFPNIEEEFS